MSRISRYPNIVPEEENERSQRLSSKLSKSITNTLIANLTESDGNAELLIDSANAALITSDLFQVIKSNMTFNNFKLAISSDKIKYMYKDSLVSFKVKRTTTSKT